MLLDNFSKYNATKGKGHRKQISISEKGWVTLRSGLQDKFKIRDYASCNFYFSKNKDNKIAIKLFKNKEGDRKVRKLQNTIGSGFSIMGLIKKKQNIVGIYNPIESENDENTLTIVFEKDE